MTSVTTAKEAIEAAAKVAESKSMALGWEIADAIRAIPVVDPVGVTVKPLQWQRNGNHWAAGHGYVIRLMGGRYILTRQNQHGREFDTLEAAQATANIDHEHYILSCLTVADDPRVAALRGAARALLNIFDNYAPFGGELYRDRVDRAWDDLRTALAAFAPDREGE